MKITNIIIIGKIYVKWFFRRPLTYMFITIFMPLSIITPMLLLSSHSNWSREITGAALFSVIGGGISDITMNVYFDRREGRLTFFFTRPVTSMEYMLGILFGGGAYTLVSAGIILAVGNVILGFTFNAIDLLLFVGIILLAWIVSSNLGFVIALYGPKDYRLAGTFSDFLLFSITFIAPVFYSIDSLPLFLQNASLFIYTTYLALIANHIINNNPLPNPLLTVTVPIVFGVTLFFSSVRKLK
ncbi:MAG: ABC transporter permease [Thermoplasmata archaeon]